MKTAIFAVTAFMLSACASASIPSRGGALEIGAETTPPHGFVAMCAKDPALCVNPRSQGTSLSAAETRALLTRVNRRVNAVVRQKQDAVLAGAQDVWRRPVADAVGFTGDCDDLATEKRLELITAGVPAENLTYALAYRRDLGLHVVLIASTADGDLVLDSRTPYVTELREAPYVWLARQSAADPMRWNSVRPADAAAASPERVAQQDHRLDTLQN